MNGYGIDSMVQSRADAYRANPDGLAKSYAQNQQLIDLLALQKLKSEKEAAARQLTLTAQQSPGTVAQQREQELLGLTRDELAKQVGAVGEQQEQVAQQRLQQAAGLSSLPAPNLEAMPRYAEGGIVGALEDEEGPSLESVLAMIGSGLSVPERALAGALAAFKNAGEYGPTLGQIAQAVKAGYRGERLEGGLPGLLEKRGSSAPEPVATETTATPAAPRTTTRDLAGVGGLASLIQQPTPAPAAAPTAVAAPQAPVAVPAEASALQRALEEAQLARLQSTPEGDRAKAIEQTQELFAPVMDERKASYEEMRRRLQEIDARESDPKARAREALREWMRGAATARGGLGETLMGGGARSRNYIDEQEAADKARLQEMFGLDKEFSDTQLDVLKNVFTASEGAMDRQSAGANTAIQAAASMVEGRLNREAEERFNVARNELLLRQAEADEAANAVAQGRLSMDEFRNTVGALDRAYQSALDPLQLQLENMPIGGDQTPIIRAMQTLQTQYAEAMSRLSGGNLPAMGGVPEEQVFDYTEFFPQ